MTIKRMMGEEKGRNRGDGGGMGVCVWGGGGKSVKLSQENRLPNTGGWGGSAEMFWGGEAVKQQSHLIAVIST